MAKAVRLISPPGYGNVVPFDRKKHGHLGLMSERRYAWCSSLNAVFVNVVEFPRAATEYPIAFAREQKSNEYVPMAVLGMRQKQNLFVNDDGSWRGQAYVPAYLRRHPFCIAEIPGKDGAAPQKLVCVQEDQLSPDGAPFFGKDGKPAAAWDPIQKLLEAIEGARQSTRVLTKRLETLDLLVPFDAVAMPRQGRQMRLQGMFRVDEQRLGQVPAKDLKTMLSKGELRAVYAHLISLENFARLLDLAMARG